MHMADALISPAVGGTMWLATAGLALYSAKKVTKVLDENKVPLMGVLGAFIFAAQMINFSIPGTGSSGHLGGAMILSILLGPHAAFLTIASVLTIQALFFADGGLLALGCNVFNLGFFPCFIAYPLIYKQIVGESPNQKRLLLGTILAAIVGLQLGAFGVVLETIYSGISDLPFTTFVLLMQPIHLAIGIVEGVVTTAVILFIWKERPEIIRKAAMSQPLGNMRIKPVLVGLLLVSLITAGGLSWFASADPDGLEWSIAKATGQQELSEPENDLYTILATIQKKVAFFPEYNFKAEENVATSVANSKGGESWPAVNSGTSVAGLVGAIMTLLLAGIIGKGLRLATKNN
ncbi:energy-coupling factor ABC transporter permease [Pelosinus sp. sgz500959]|uniref:energy-coupling factor ABC transporter permease n=1 Tax=Pelosinus sp. sgz500959 TaxID=3242472 RepID=UPI00366BE230